MTNETQIPDEIECAKSDLRAKLKLAFIDRAVNQAEAAELTDEIDAIVSRANNHRGTYRETNAYLGCDITAHPDSAPQPSACGCPLATSEDDHRVGCPHGLDLLNDGGVSLIGTPYTPSPAIAAMVEFANANPTWSTSQRYRTFTVLIAGIRAERPDWSREQARDWLRAQS